MITIEVRRDGRMIGFVEFSMHEGWRWIAVEGYPQPEMRKAFPSYEEALTDMIDALGGV